ncbi:hypothetical protein C0J52_09959 [Blattella germanica]|nr:hypothetical protein C0J52_09959 [Blattella germanica]
MWKHYQDSPTVISVEMNYIDWNNSLPSFYICPDEKVNADSLAETSKSLASSDTDIAIVKDFLTELANTTYYNLEALKSFVGKIKIPSNEYLNLVKKVSHNYTYQMANQEVKTAANNMYQITTEHGLCYAYNSQVAKSLVEFSGKCVANGFIGLEMGMDILYATEAIYKMPIKRRKCRFANESNLQISSIYSQNMCHSQCRIQLALKLCGCAPFFYDLLVKGTWERLVNPEETPVTILQPTVEF